VTRRIKHAKTALQNTPSVAYSDWNDYFVDESGNTVDLDEYGALAEDELVTGDWKFGSLTDHVDITDGVITFANAAKRLLTMRPTLYAGSVAGSGKPSSVQVGIHAGYSLPISNGADGEVLYFRDYVPGRWDGVTDPIVSVICCLDTANTAGEDFAITLMWDNNDPTTGAVSATNNVTVPIQTELTTGHTAQYSLFKVLFTVDASAGPVTALTASDHLALKLYRTAVTGVGADECEGEIVVLDVLITYTVDKVFKRVP
jgi:hypothetical protein